MDVATDFTLRAYVEVRNRHEFGRRIYNWQVYIRPDGCGQGLQLVPPSQGLGPTVFWYDGEQSVIRAAGEHGVPAALLIQQEIKHGVRDVQLSCSNSSSPMGIGVVDGLPMVQYQEAKASRSARIMACQDGDDVKVGYRPKATSPLPDVCAEIQLTAECVQGQDHGLSDIALCCGSTKNGQCRHAR
ncbi:hypothetical protein VHEMI05596 [[Torrubiella] hemipterigena]|uniref:Uncharacterized protein n=1 Tax=[Torrubiella] hemipterigena TaxID=1531966 RepID=A0A0A1TH23_9HYPO|nr:hypothetical protein VHEMI05596 [[Torrubiella] hemipterigena]